MLLSSPSLLLQKVPYLDFKQNTCTGTNIGIVAAGGHIGALLFGLEFRNRYERGFNTMGITVLVSSILCLVVKVPNETSLLGLLIGEKKTTQNQNQEEDPQVQTAGQKMVEEEMEA